VGEVNSKYVISVIGFIRSLFRPSPCVELGKAITGHFSGHKVLTTREGS
jgi:hypothetical protein